MESELKAVYKSVLEGKQAEVEEGIRRLLDIGADPQIVLNDGLIAPMEEVGNRFEQGDLYVPEMLVAAKSMHAGLALLKPLLVEQGIPTSGTVVMGSIMGDLHDIGKTLVSMMLEGAGFEVIDLGTDVSPETFATAARDHNAQAIGISALLTTTMVNMKPVIDAVRELGLRDKTKIIIGGAPVTEAFAVEIGADGYAADASRAVSLVKRLLS
jgi:5-methyltetrahydrofolate--homocysteine methyltransferase